MQPARAARPCKLTRVIFEIVTFLAAILAGGIAAISGFGIGSLLTPLFATQFDTRIAVALVSIPHFVATLARFLTLREHLDRRVLLHFGLLSGAGGLTGALLHANITNVALTAVFAVLLLFTGISGLSGFAQRMRFGKRSAWIAGAVSGFLGGLVGNQGGIRSGAMLGFDIDRHAFVATATAVGVIVDLTRMPVYIASQHESISANWQLLLVASVGSLIGTFFGVRLLRRLSEPAFRAGVSTLITLLGAWMLWQASRA
jgi:uncharacterized membrane protein YfcA